MPTCDLLPQLDPQHLNYRSDDFAHQKSAGCYYRASVARYLHHKLDFCLSMPCSPLLVQKPLAAAVNYVWMD